MCVRYSRVSVPRGIHEYRGGYLEHPSVPWGDIMINVGDILSTVWGGGGGEVILSTVGDTQYRGGYHDAGARYYEYRGGCSVR